MTNPGGAIRRHASGAMESDGQVHAVRPARQSHIGAAVHQHACAVRIRQTQHRAHEFGQRARGQILLANLNQVHAVIERPCHRAEKIACRFSIGDVVAQHQAGS